MTFRNITGLIVAIALVTFGCKQESKPTVNTKSSDLENSVIEEGYVKSEESRPISRPVIKKEQAGFSSDEKTSAKEKAGFLFDDNWRVISRIEANKNGQVKPEKEYYRFNHDGTYKYMHDSDLSDKNGLWQMSYQNQTVTLTLYPDDSYEKVSEWTIKYLDGKMLWVGTPTYRDNAVMQQLKVM